MNREMIPASSDGNLLLNRVFNSELLGTRVRQLAAGNGLHENLALSLRWWLAEYICFLMRELRVEIPDPASIDYSVPAALEQALTVAQRRLLERYRRTVLTQDISDGLQNAKIAAAGALYRKNSRSDASLLCGEPIDLATLPRVVARERHPEHPRYEFVREYLRSTGKAGPVGPEDERYIGTFLHWLCRLRNIRYATENSERILAALRSLSRDDLVLYRVSRTRSVLKISLRRRQRSLSVVLAYLQWLYKAKRWRGTPWVGVPFLQDDPTQHRQAEKPPIRLFQEFLQSQAITADTATNYRSLIWIFFGWLASRRVPHLLRQPTDEALESFDLALREITSRDVLDFRTALRGLAMDIPRPKKVRCFKMLRRFYAFLEGTGRVPPGTVTSIAHLHATEISRREDRSGELPANARLRKTRRPALKVVEAFLRSRPRSPKTIREYKNVLWHYIWWLAEQGGVMLSVRTSEAQLMEFEVLLKGTSRVDIANYRDYLKSPSTKGRARQRALKFQVVKTFFGWLASTKQILRDPTVSFPLITAEEITNSAA